MIHPHHYAIILKKRGVASHSKLPHKKMMATLTHSGHEYGHKVLLDEVAVE